jgi:hypothetical protein
MSFQPLHRDISSSNTGTTNLHKKMFQRNFTSSADGSNSNSSAAVQGGGSGSIASPTDNIMSPCSQKLSAHKNRFFAK